MEKVNIKVKRKKKAEKRALVKLERKKEKQLEKLQEKEEPDKSRHTDANEVSKKKKIKEISTDNSTNGQSSLEHKTKKRKLSVEDQDSGISTQQDHKDKKKKKKSKKRDFTELADKGTDATKSKKPPHEEIMDTSHSRHQEERLIIGPQKTQDEQVHSVQMSSIFETHNDKTNNITPTKNNPKVKINDKITSPVMHKGKFVFSKFDFITESGMKGKQTLNQKGKDYQRLLEKVKTKKEKIESVREKDKEKADALEMKYQWKAALARAAGEKVKDDEQLLRKAVKRKEYKQKKTKKNWEQRCEHVTKKIDQRQKKRSDNIKRKKQGRIDNKIKKAKKKGRLFSGF